jgi:Ca-activated chloride channel family protein
VKAALAGLLGLAACGLIPVAGAQQTQFPPLRVQVGLVNVFVNVTNANGVPVAGLTRQDFAVSEDGHPQKIAVFERQTGLPLSIVLAIDTSGSVRKDLQGEKRAAREFLRATLRPEDRVEIVDFNTRVHEAVAFTNNLKKIDRGLNRLSRGPATALYAAIAYGARELAQRPGRKVLVVISDGGNTVANGSYPQALDQAVRAEAMIFSVIDLPVANDAGRDVGGEHAMIALSEATGGEYYYEADGDLQDVFERLSTALRTEYLIGYYPKHSHSAHHDYHSIGVRLTTPNASTYRVRYRKGYFTASTAAEEGDGPQDGGPDGAWQP